MTWEAGVSIITVGVMWFFSLLMINIDDKEHVILKFFLMLVSVWFVPVAWNIAQQLAIANSAATAVLNALDIGYNVVLTSSLVITAYLMIYYIKSIMTLLVDIARARREGDD